MNKTYRIINNSLGWLIGIIACAVYILTVEPTQSWWDCGEYIATAHKMLVGHPPGAPTFQIIGAVFSQFAGNDPAMVGYWVNIMSALFSGFGIMFLFWTITLLGKKLVANLGGFTTLRTVAIFAAGIVGALTYTFTDTYWFSAVEGEVYAMSSFFTALVFWCILKWDEEYDNPKPNTNPARWIVLIFYLIGLSIGVHLLNLLTIPAMGLIIYYKLSKKASYKGVLLALTFIAFGMSILYSMIWMLAIWLLIVAPLIYISFKNGAIRSKAEWGVLGSLVASMAVVGIILWGIIPGIVSWAGKFEIFSKNSLGLPFNAGTIIYFMLILGAIGYALYYSYKKKKALLKICAYSLFFLLIGYSTFVTLVIRSNANPTIDENSPEDAVSLLSYLNREQYGATPFLYGKSYNTRHDRRQPYKDGTPVYVRDDKAGKYVIADDRKQAMPNYDTQDLMFIPRMWDPAKKDTYMYWMRNNVYNTGSISDRDNLKHLEGGKLPTMEQNKAFLHSFQLNYMYWRYFMWNFVGRQNEIQGLGDLYNGNWISGVPFLDNKRLGKQNELPITMQRKGNNTYFFLPLILGIIGLVYYSRKDLKNSFVVFMLFLMTGWAIAFYLNNASFQPRERDYAYAASFYAFCIWVGFGVFALIAMLEKWKNQKGQLASAVIITLICVGLVPGIMAKENWDDHDRSFRYTALAFAKNYLDTCEPNAIFFTMGDNETFPLWYAQEVEGYRTDVRVCNLSLLNGAWYIDQMKRKAYNSDPLPISMVWEQYRDGTRDQLLFDDAGSQFVDLKGVIDYIKDPRFDNKRVLIFLGESQRYMSAGTGSGARIPSSFSIPVDREKVLANGTVRPEDAHLIVDRITWNRRPIKSEGNWIMKSNMILMDILAHFNWDRPIYFSMTSGPEAYFSLEEYFQVDGMAYRLVPIKSRGGRSPMDIGRVNVTTLPDKLLYDFPNHARVDLENNPDRTQKPVYPYLWGGLNDPRVYHPEETARMFGTVKAIYLRTANQLAAEGNIEKAELIHDKLIEIFNPDIIPYIFVGNPAIPYTIMQVGALLRLGTPTATEKGMNIASRMLDELKETFDWFEKGDAHTLAIQGENIENMYQYITYLMNQLSEEQLLLLEDKFEQLNVTKSVTSLAAQIASEIDFHFKRLPEAQRQMFDKFLQLGQLGDFAVLVNDLTLEQNIAGKLREKIDMVATVDPQAGRVLREHFLAE
ncbi:MAG: DUF2723 domain-containing protein [Lentimicrobiaceae bacterium]|nr:DUF2723 domain-containing protein [Lentimicrobiaceae bacterium]